MGMLALEDLSVVFISYDEPRCEHNWRDLLRKCRWAKRVHGVTGFDEAHKAAARLSTTKHFITVDGDTIVEPWLFQATVPALDGNVLIAWRSRNAINGLVYGNGSVKCWPRRLALEMRTHERSAAGSTAVDFGLGPARKRFFAEEIPATTYPNATPFQAFRTGFREGVRLCLVDGEPAVRLAGDLNPWQVHYLRVWCSIGADAANGLWALLGARLGCAFTALEVDDPRLINDYHWFLGYWDDHIAPRFSGGDCRCPLSGYVWDRGRLEAAVATAGERLRQELGLPIVDLTAEQSHGFKKSFASTPAESGSRYDLLGNLHQRVGAGPAGAEEAGHCYRMGSILGSMNAMNNLARLNQSVSAGDLGDTLELLLNATALGNPFAPSALADMLRDGDHLRAAPEQALHYYSVAAKLGHSEALVSAAEMLASGDGVPRDLDAARDLYREAAAAGDRRAKNALHRLTKKPPRETSGTMASAGPCIELPTLADSVLFIKDLQVVFLTSGAGDGDERWRALTGCCRHLSRPPTDGTELLDSGAPESSCVIVVRDDCVIDPRFFDLAIDRGRLADTRAIVWPARDAITGLLSYEFGPQCWPRALIERQLHLLPNIAAPDAADLGTECLAVHASADSPRQAFHSGFSAARRILRALRAGPSQQSPDRQRRRMLELGLWCSIGVDCAHGLWSIYGARLACASGSEPTADGDDSEHHWHEARRSRDARDLQAAIVRLGHAIRQTSAIDVMDLSAAASTLLKEISRQSHLPECSEQMAKIAISRGDEAGHRKAAQLYRVAAGFGGTQALRALGRLYQQGLGVVEDERRGAYLLSVAAGDGITVPVQ